LAEAAALARELQSGPEISLKLRNEVIAALAMIDLRPGQRFAGYPPGSTLTGTGFDRQMERYARVDQDGSVSVRRLADDHVLLRIGSTGAPWLGRRSDWRMTLIFSPDGRYLAASGVPNDQAPLQVWDLRDAKVLLKAPAVGGYQQRLDFSFD